MTFLPIVGRELRVSARRPRLYWGRFIAGTAAIGLVTWMWIFSAGEPSTGRAQQLFVGLAVLGFIYALFTGFLLTADVISEEKREGTLGLLFLTDLKGYDVVFGKLAASSLYAFYGLMAIFPVLALPLLLGGLTFGQVGRIAAVLLNTLWFSLSIGIFVSSFSRHDRKAQFGAFLVILFVTAGIPLLAYWWAKWTHQFVPLSMYAPSPVFCFIQAFEKNFTRNTYEFWLSLGTLHGLGWLALLSAAIIVRRTWQDRPRTSAGARWKDAWRRWQAGSPGKRQRYREALLNINPFYWLSSRDRLKPAYILSVIAGAGLLWLILFLRDPESMFDQASFFMTAIILHMVLKIWLCSESGRLLAEDRRNGALELTLSTPLSVKDILEGQFLGLLRQFGLAAAIILVADVVMMVLGARLKLQGGDSDWIVLCFAGILVLVMDLFTIPTLGMWLGLTSKRASRAALMTGFYILILPWLVLIGFVTFVSLARIGLADSVHFFAGSYFIISLVINLILFLWASGNLTTRFREVVTERYDSAR